MGLLTPVGNDLPSSWQALKAGVQWRGPDHAVRRDGGLRLRFAAEVKGFAVENYLERKEAKRMDRFAQFAMAASQEAVRQAGLGTARTESISTASA
jgi:3-oxoacyl-[acyl-carrier-protein] synthase II